MTALMQNSVELHYVRDGTAHSQYVRLKDIRGVGDPTKVNDIGTEEMQKVEVEDGEETRSMWYRVKDKGRMFYDKFNRHVKFGSAHPTLTNKTHFEGIPMKYIFLSEFDAKTFLVLTPFGQFEETSDGDRSQRLKKALEGFNVQEIYETQFSHESITRLTKDKFIVARKPTTSEQRFQVLFKRKKTGAVEESDSGYVANPSFKPLDQAGQTVVKTGYQLKPYEVWLYDTPYTNVKNPYSKSRYFVITGKEAQTINGRRKVSVTSLVNGKETKTIRWLPNQS